MTDQDWMPRPGPEHAQLKPMAGTWKVDCTYYMGPDQPPMTVQAKETVEMLGEFWTVSRFQSSMMGVPFEGKAMVGYDPARRSWVGTWIDTFTPFFFAFEGGFDPSGRVLKLAGRGADPQSGALVNYRTTEEVLDPDHRVFEMFKELPDGGEMKIFRYVYTRAPKEAAGKARTAAPKAKPKPARAAAGKTSAGKGARKTGAAKGGKSARRAGGKARPRSKKRGR